MDMIREKTGLDSDSDADDEIYSAIHNSLREFTEESIKQGLYCGTCGQGAKNDLERETIKELAGFCSKQCEQNDPMAN
jgi:hypothetical protein